MECSICYEEINTGTGKVELSCSHPFHFSCIAKWFDRKRLDGSSESCPNCRHDMTEFETMPDAIYWFPNDSDELEDAANDPSTWGPLEDDNETWINNITSVFQEEVPYVYSEYSLLPLEEDSETWLNNIEIPVDETREESLQRMQRESDEIGNAITGPEGIWRKNRLGEWVNISGLSSDHTHGRAIRGGGGGSWQDTITWTNNPLGSSGR